MIIEYHRPMDESQALELLNRKSPRSIPLGGGTIVSKTSEEVALVDLQSLGLDYIKEDGAQLSIGSMTTLEDILTHFGKESAIGQAILIEAGKNIRSMATLGGALISNGGRSTFLTVLAALDIKFIWKPDDRVVDIDAWLSNRNAGKFGKYISEVRIPKDIRVAFESVGRSPLDLPIICFAVGKRPDGKIRIAVGGFGEVPTLIYNGDANGDFIKAVDTSLKTSGDEWASAKYRGEAGTKLVQRLVKALAAGISEEATS